MNVIVPVALLSEEATVAVKVTDAPETDGLAEGETEMEVARLAP
jgi:hypothetical protein